MIKLNNDKNAIKKNDELLIIFPKHQNLTFSSNF